MLNRTPVVALMSGRFCKSPHFVVVLRPYTLHYRFTMNSRIKNDVALDRGSPALMRRINARQVLDAMRILGPCSRVALTRHSGLSAPTVSKLIENLLHWELVEALPPRKPVSTGRPSVIYQLARNHIQYLGVVIDIERCRVVSAGLDGVIAPDRTMTFKTPSTYRALIRAITRHCRDVASRHPARVLGVGVSVPGLLDRRSGQQVLSPNLHFMDGHAPAGDIEQESGFTTVAVQEEEGLCRAEQLFGHARGLENFAMIDISAGLGMGVVSGDRFINGACGFAGELGHVTVEPDGALCGCGNRGCLETVATDLAFIKAVNARTGKDWDMDSLLAAVGNGQLECALERERVLAYLAVGVGMVIGLFNPSHIFCYGRFFDLDDHAFPELIERVNQHAMQPAVAHTKIVRARGSKRLGALAAIVEHSMAGIAPRLS